MDSISVYLVFLPFVSVLITVEAENACHNGWLSYRNSCYRLSREKENWVEANVNCQLFHSELVDITDADENNFLKYELMRLHNNDPNRNQACYLTSGTDMFVEGEWEWASTGQKMTFTDWYPNEPNNQYPGREENCLCLFGKDDFRWNDEPCDHPFYFICRTNQSNHNTVQFG